MQTHTTAVTGEGKAPRMSPFGVVDGETVMINGKAFVVASLKGGGWTLIDAKHFTPADVEVA